MQLYELFEDGTQPFDSTTLAPHRLQGIRDFIKRGTFIWPDAMIADIYQVPIEFVQSERQRTQPTTTQPSNITQRIQPSRTDTDKVIPDEEEDGWSLDNVKDNLKKDWDKLKNIFN